MSKARNLIDLAEATNKDVVDRALKWWNNLSPDKQKEFLSKVPAEKVSKIYRDIYGTSPVASAVASEDMSKTKKIITAAALAAFLLASSPAHAGSPTQADYDKYDKMRSYQQQPSKGQQEYSREMQDKEDGSPSLSSVADVAKRAIDTYGNTHTQQRADKISQDVEFIKSVLDTLSGK